jgi:large subunit ribosomal protein L33
MGPWPPPIGGYCLLERRLAGAGRGFGDAGVLSGSGSMREYVWLECTTCGDRNYRTQKETRGAERLELKKYCRRERKHTRHKESRKK